MINDLFGVIARIFPVLTVILTIAALIFLARAWSRMSSGSIGAGPTLIAAPTQVGLQRVPWEILGLSEAIRSNSTQPLELLGRRAEALGVPVQVPTHVPPQVAVDSVLDQLERALGLPPLEPSIPRPGEQIPFPPNQAPAPNQESLTS